MDSRICVHCGMCMFSETPERECRESRPRNFAGVLIRFVPSRAAALARGEKEKKGSDRAAKATRAGIYNHVYVRTYIRTRAKAGLQCLSDTGRQGGPGMAAGGTALCKYLDMKAPVASAHVVGVDTCPVRLRHVFKSEY